MSDNLNSGFQNYTINPDNKEREKPYYDNNAPPVIQSQNAQPYYSSNQPNNIYQNNYQNIYQNNPMTINPSVNYSNYNNPNIPIPQTCTNTNNSNNNIQNLVRNEPELPRIITCKQFYAAWTLIILVLLDIILQIMFGFVNPFSMVDDAAILGLSIVFLIHSFKRQSIKKFWIGTLTVLVWFVGFALRGFSMAFATKGSIAGIPINFFILVAKTFVLFFSIPLACNTRNRNHYDDYY